MQWLSRMNTWTRPEMIEIKMDAEISSYQEDPDPWRNDPLLRDARATDDDARAADPRR
jgi:hypothetical protein